MSAAMLLRVGRRFTQSILVRLKSPIMITGKLALRGVSSVSRAKRKNIELAKSVLGG